MLHNISKFMGYTIHSDQILLYRFVETMRSFFHKWYGFLIPPIRKIYILDCRSNIVIVHFIIIIIVAMDDTSSWHWTRKMELLLYYSMLQSGMSTIHKRSTFLTVLSFYFYITFLEDYCEDDKKSWYQSTHFLRDF